MNKPRYIITEYGTRYAVVLSDYAYWAERYTELFEWTLKFPGSILEGMVLELPNEEAVMLFKITWT